MWECPEALRCDVERGFDEGARGALYCQASLECPASDHNVGQLLHEIDLGERFFGPRIEYQADSGRATPLHGAGNDLRIGTHTGRTV